MTRVTIIAGFLGAGKTSIIRHLLSNGNGNTAVLVNEIGSIGIDGNLIEQAAANNGEIVVREMAGGCICCTAQLPFRQAIVELLRRKPDRLIVEPTGVAAVGAVRDVFAEDGIAPAVTLDPILVVIDPRQWDKPELREHPLYQEQCQAADVMAMSHTDCCDEDLLARFRQAHQDLPVITAKHGVLDNDWTQLQPTFRPTSDIKPHSKGIIKKQLFWPSDQIVDLQELEQLWHKLQPNSDVLRCKGVVLTQSGWQSFQIHAGSLESSPSTAREQSALVCLLFDKPESQSWWRKTEQSLETYWANQCEK